MGFPTFFQFAYHISLELRGWSDIEREGVSYLLSFAFAGTPGVQAIELCLKGINVLFAYWAWGQLLIRDKAWRQLGLLGLNTNEPIFFSVGEAQSTTKGSVLDIIQVSCSFQIMSRLIIPVSIWVQEGELLRALVDVLT
jgi:hypothetical protein